MIRNKKKLSKFWFFSLASVVSFSSLIFLAYNNNISTHSSAYNVSNNIDKINQRIYYSNFDNIKTVDINQIFKGNSASSAITIDAKVPVTEYTWNMLKQYIQSHLEQFINNPIPDTVVTIIDFKKLPPFQNGTPGAKGNAQCKIKINKYKDPTTQKIINNSITSDWIYLNGFLNFNTSGKSGDWLYNDNLFKEIFGQNGDYQYLCDWCNLAVVSNSSNNDEAIKNFFKNKINTWLEQDNGANINKFFSGGTGNQTRISSVGSIKIEKDANKIIFNYNASPYFLNGERQTNDLACSVILNFRTLPNPNDNSPSNPLIGFNDYLQQQLPEGTLFPDEAELKKIVSDYLNQPDVKQQLPMQPSTYYSNNITINNYNSIQQGSVTTINQGVIQINNNSINNIHNVTIQDYLASPIDFGAMNININVANTTLKTTEMNFDDPLYDLLSNSYSKFAIDWENLTQDAKTTLEETIKNQINNNKRDFFNNLYKNDFTQVYSVQITPPKNNSTIATVAIAFSGVENNARKNDITANVSLNLKSFNEITFNDELNQFMQQEIVNNNGILGNDATAINQKIQSLIEQFLNNKKNTQDIPTTFIPQNGTGNFDNNSIVIKPDLIIGNNPVTIKPGAIVANNNLHLPNKDIVLYQKTYINNINAFESISNLNPQDLELNLKDTSSNEYNQILKLINDNANTIIVNGISGATVTEIESISSTKDSLTLNITLSQAATIQGSIVAPSNNVKLQLIINNFKYSQPVIPAPTPNPSPSVPPSWGNGSSNGGGISSSQIPPIKPNEPSVIVSNNRGNIPWWFWLIISGFILVITLIFIGLVFVGKEKKTKE